MDKIYESKISLKWGMEAPGIDPGTSRMLSERSTIWATPPVLRIQHYVLNIFFCILCGAIIYFYPGQTLYERMTLKKRAFNTSIFYHILI